MQLVCDLCGKTAEFRVSPAPEVGGHAGQNLCRRCAEDLERTPHGRSAPSTDLLNDLETPTAPTRPNEDMRTSVCPVCGNSVIEVTEAAVVGCPSCYEVFHEEVQAMVRRLHSVP